MSAIAGDIVATFGLDGKKWFDEAKKIQDSAASLGVQVQKGLSGRGSIAVDTLTSGLSGGLTSAVSTATGGLQGALSSRFGAIGAGVGVVAGAAIVSGIASLLDEQNAFASISETVATTNRELDAFIQRQGRLSEFSLKIDDISTESGAKSLEKSIDSQIGSARDRFASIQAQERNIAAEIRKTEEARDAARLLSNGATPLSRGVGRFGEFVAGKLGIELPVDQLNEQIDKLKSQLGEIRASGRSAGADIGALQKQKELLEEEKGNIADRQSAAEAERIRSSDPFLSRQKQLEDINRLVSGGFLERSVGLTAAQGIVKDFRQSVTQPLDSGRPNTANVAGTSAAFSALQATFRQDRSAQDQLTDAARAQLAVLEKILLAVQSPPKEDQGADI